VVLYLCNDVKVCSFFQLCSKFIMEWREKQALSNCRVFFVENIHDVTDLLDDFLEAGLVSVDDAEEITAQTTKLRSKQSFLNQLPTWGPRTYSVLVKSLERTGHQHVCDKLNEELKFVQHTKSVPRVRDTGGLTICNIHSSINYIYLKH
jgi:hypothetical protein